jgi:UDP-glucose 4-epimerase
MSATLRTRTFERSAISMREVKSCALDSANSRAYSVKEVITAAEEVCGRYIPLETARRRSGPPILIGDAGEARRRVTC